MIFVRKWRTLFHDVADQNEVGELKEIEMMPQLEEDFESAQKGVEILEI